MPEFKAPPPPGGVNFQPQVNQPQTSEPAPVQAEQEIEPAAPEERPAESQSEPVSSVEPVTTNETSTSNAMMDKLQIQKEKVMAQFNALPSNKKQVLIFLGIFILGLLMGAVLFGGDSEPEAPAPTGLQGVVANPDIKTPLKRCGQVEASSACVLYVMNSYSYEKLAEDFFDTVAGVTGRKGQVVRMDNVRYATMRIPPGYFAQIKIPAYK